MIEKFNAGEIRIRNQKMILENIKIRVETTRAEIAKISHLTRPAVSQLIDSLLEKGILTESGKQLSTGGKPPISLRLNGCHACFLSIDFSDFKTIYTSLLSLSGETLLSATEEVPLNDSELFSKIETTIRNICADHGNKLKGILFPVRGILSRDRTYVQESLKTIPRDLISKIKKITNLPVFLERNAHAIAYGHLQMEKDLNDFLYIYLGRGISSGIILNRKIFRGILSGAGELAHLPTGLKKPLCKCGLTGCLESFFEPEHFSLFIHNSKNGFRQAGEIAGVTLAPIAEFINIPVVRLGGRFNGMGDEFLSGMCTKLEERLLRLSEEYKAALDLNFAKSDTGVGAIGGCHILIDKYLNFEIS